MRFENVVCQNGGGGWVGGGCVGVGVGGVGCGVGGGVGGVGGGGLSEVLSACWIHGLV